MAASACKIILGMPPYLDQAMIEWAQKEPTLKLIALPVSFNKSYEIDLSALSSYKPSKATAFVALGDHFLNLKRYEMFMHVKKLGFKMPPLICGSNRSSDVMNLLENTWIQSGAFKGNGVKVGFNSIIATRSAVYDNCQIGENTMILEGATVDQNCKIGAFVTIGRHVLLKENTQVGRFSRLTKMASYQNSYSEGTFIEDRFTGSIVL